MRSGQLGHRTVPRSHVPLPYPSLTTELFSHSHELCGFEVLRRRIRADRLRKVTIEEYLRRAPRKLPGVRSPACRQRNGACPREGVRRRGRYSVGIRFIASAWS